MVGGSPPAVDFALFFGIFETLVTLTVGKVSFILVDFLDAVAFVFEPLGAIIADLRGFRVQLMKPSDG